MFCPSSYDPYPWMELAMQEYGIREFPGRGRNRNIASYLATVGRPRANDETPWCSAFVNWCVSEGGLRGTNRGNARSWLTWEEATMSLAKPVWGCIAVLWRVRRSSWQGHVGFYVGSVGNRVMLLGGNQGNAVSEVPSPSQGKAMSPRWALSHSIAVQNIGSEAQNGMSCRARSKWIAHPARAKKTESTTTVIR